jgi:hypothetical protein
MPSSLEELPEHGQAKPDLQSKLDALDLCGLEVIIFNLKVSRKTRSRVLELQPKEPPNDEITCVDGPLPIHLPESTSSH